MEKKKHPNRKILERLNNKRENQKAVKKQGKWNIVIDFPGD